MKRCKCDAPHFSHAIFNSEGERLADLCNCGGTLGGRCPACEAWTDNPRKHAREKASCRRVVLKLAPTAKQSADQKTGSR